MKDVTSYGHYLVGRSYFYGSGIDINYEKAVFQYKLSAEAGNSTAQNKLALCYEDGTGIFTAIKSRPKLETPMDRTIQVIATKTARDRNRFTQGISLVSKIGRSWKPR